MGMEKNKKAHKAFYSFNLEQFFTDPVCVLIATLSGSTITTQKKL